MVMAWAGISPAVPDGWLLCDGSQISKTTYSHLYDTIGAGYGTVNSTTFALPDLGGRAIYGIYTGNSLTMGLKTTIRLLADFKSTTSSDGPTTHTATTVAYQYPVIPKDAPSYNLSTAVSDHVAHTHDVTHPAIIMRYVIRA
jgi:microcystin-dependent protein